MAPAGMAAPPQLQSSPAGPTLPAPVSVLGKVTERPLLKGSAWHTALPLPGMWPGAHVSQVFLIVFLIFF